MFIAMNCFRVKKGAEGAFEKVWMSCEFISRSRSGFCRVPSAQRARSRRPYALCLPYSVADQSCLRGMDQVGGVPRRARARRQRSDRATLSGTSQIRGIRGTTDGHSQGGGRITRFRPLRLVLRSGGKDGPPFGAVMGMDWHSSGITTSVLGALKRGLTPLGQELGIHVCGGPANIHDIRRKFRSATVWVLKSQTRP